VSTRLCVSTCKDRRANFNQVALEKDVPDRVVLASIDRNIGVRVWVVEYPLVEALTGEQHGSYSRHLGPINVDDPPAELGSSIDIPAAWFPADVWKTLTSANTNTLHKSAEDAFRVLFGLA